MDIGVREKGGGGRGEMDIGERKEEGWTME